MSLPPQKNSYPGPIGRSSLLTLALGLALTSPVLADDSEDIAALRSLVETMRADYEQRISELEGRLAAAERRAQPSATATPSLAMTLPVQQATNESTQLQASDAMPGQDSDRSTRGAIGAGGAFNPQISAILDGNYYRDSASGQGAIWVGEAFRAGMAHSHDEAESHDHASGDSHAGHAHGTPDNGFNFSSAELTFSATVDPYFDASLYLAIDSDGNVELEEGYLQTRSLPQGLRVKGGKFLSDFGYINRQHPHAWDFADQNLPYLNLLGSHGLQDTGLQLTWLPELPVYSLFGIEAFQGDQEIFGSTLGETEQAALNLNKTKSGPRLWTAFAKIAPDIGRNQALQLGLSYAHATQQQLALSHEHEHEHDHEHEEHDEHESHHSELHQTGLDGDADLWGIDLVYKYDGGGVQGQGDFKFQSEYLRSIKDLTIRSSEHAEDIGTGRTFTTDGLYAQATYGIAPKWRAGLRYDVLGLTNKISGEESEGFGSSDRWTANLTWDLSEFSRLRAQYAYNDILIEEDHRETFSAFYLQFIVSLGSHGAHDF